MSGTGAQQAWSLRQAQDRTVVILSGDWIAPDSRSVAIGLEPIFHAAPPPRTLAFDATALGRWDSALIAFLWQLRIGAETRHIAIDDGALPASARKLLRLMTDGKAAVIPPPAHAGPLTRIGVGVTGIGTLCLAVATQLGEVILSIAGLLGARARMRGTDLVNAIRAAGADALLIVAVVNFLVGAILAFVGVVQLRRFGAGIYVANLVGIAMVREMAGVVTAVVMAGRTGGAYAAEIATMQGNEEIDALRVFGIPVQDYLILPRMIALTTMMPLLYLYGSAVGLLGGFAVAVSMLDMTSAAYMLQTRNAISGTQFLIGLSKSVVFGAMVAFIGCMIGLRAGRSAADVGRASTSAVVAGIVGVIVVDAAFAVCLNALGL